MGLIVLNPVDIERQASSFEPSSKCKVSKRFCSFSYSECEHIWSYLGKIILITRNLLNAAARNCMLLAETGQNFGVKIKEVVTHMKLFSIFSAFFSLKDLKLSAHKVLKSISLGDKEGIALTALSTAIIAADIFDSLTTFINTVLLLVSSAVNQTLSALGLPLGLAISSAGVLSRSIQLTKTLKLSRTLKRSLVVNSNYKNRKALKEFLERKMAATESEKSKFSQVRLKRHVARKRAALSRSAPEVVLKEFDRLYELVKGVEKDSFSTEQGQEIFKTLKHIEIHLKKKMRVDGCGILANLVMISALLLFLFGVLNSFPFLLLAAGFGIRLAALVYQDKPLKPVHC